MIWYKDDGSACVCCRIGGGVEVEDKEIVGDVYVYVYVYVCMYVSHIHTYGLDVCP